MFEAFEHDLGAPSLRRQAKQVHLSFRTGGPAWTQVIELLPLHDVVLYSGLVGEPNYC